MPQIRELFDVAGKQERVGRPLLADRRWNGRPICRPLLFDLTESIGYFLAFRERRGRRSGHWPAYIRERSRASCRPASSPAGRASDASARGCPRTAVRSPWRTACRRRTRRYPRGRYRRCGRCVWPGTSHTSASWAPRRMRSPSPMGWSSPGTRPFSPAGPMIVAPVASLIARLPPVWSGCQWVLRIGGDPPAALSASASTGAGSPGSTTAVSTAVSVVDQPQIIVGEGRDSDDFERRSHYQFPVLGIEAQGSAGSRCPCWSSSIEIPSGRFHERHVTVARRAVDGDASVHQALAGGVDIVDPEGEMAEVAAARDSPPRPNYE